jgi:hypothetical protein
MNIRYWKQFIIFPSLLVSFMLVSQSFGQIQKQEKGDWGLFVDTPIWSDQEEGNPVLLTFERSFLDLGNWNFGGFVGISHIDVNDIADSHVTGGFVEGTETFATHSGITARRPLIAGLRFALHADFAAGIYYAEKSFPADGSHLNFSLQAGFESSWKAAHGDDTAWILGLRWMHVSNANILPRNSGYDGLFVRFGRRWIW